MALLKQNKTLYRAVARNFSEEAWEEGMEQHDITPSPPEKVRH